MEEKKKEKKEDKKVDGTEKTNVKKETVKKNTPKKEETKKVKVDKKETKKSWILPTVIAVVVIAIIAVLTFMIVTSSDPKKSVDGLFTDLKAGDFEKAQELLNITDESDLLDDTVNNETKALLFNKLEWKVKNVTENENEAYVEVEVTNKNYKTIITNMMQKTLKAAFSGEEVTEQKSQNYLIEELKNEQVEMTTVTKTINAVKVDKKWKIVENSELLDALLPGLQEAINSIG